MLVGYDEHGVPLKPAQIFEDVSSDYAQKTVTIEPFHHGHAGPDSSATSSASAVGVATASIHPCKHASVMKKVIERMNASVIEGAEEGGGCVGRRRSGKREEEEEGMERFYALSRGSRGRAMQRHRRRQTARMQQVRRTKQREKARRTWKG